MFLLLACHHFHFFFYILEEEKGEVERYSLAFPALKENCSDKKEPDKGEEGEEAVLLRDFIKKFQT